MDELLAAAVEHGFSLDWHAGNCRVRFHDGGPVDPVEVPIRSSVIRAALARVAVLCNERHSHSVSPYGGQGELVVGTDPGTPLRVVFVNTPDEQRLEVAPVRSPVVSESDAVNGPGQESSVSKTRGFGEQRETLRTPGPSV